MVELLGAVCIRSRPRFGRCSMRRDQWQALTVRRCSRPGRGRRWRPPLGPESDGGDRWVRGRSGRLGPLTCRRSGRHRRWQPPLRRSLHCRCAASMAGRRASSMVRSPRRALPSRCIANCPACSASAAKAGVSLRGRSSTPSSSRRAAVANVEPVSPSPTRASRASRSSCASIRLRQMSMMYCRTTAFREAGAAIIPGSGSGNSGCCPTRRTLLQAV